MVKDSDHLSKYFPSNIWRISIRQNFPRQIFVLYVVHFVIKNVINSPIEIVQ